MIRRTLLTLASVLALTCAHAQNSGLVGDWEIVTTGLTSIGGQTTYVMVTIEENAGKLEAFAYNGPVALRVDGDEFELDLDWRSGFDVEYLSTFKGRLTEEGTLEGELLNHGVTNFLGRQLRDGTFTGTRPTPRPDLEGLAPEPVDMTGIYNRATGLGGATKIYFSMTEQGQQVLDDYLEMDNANSRCASPGLVLASGMPYPVEIVHTKNHILIVYGADYARRIYLDGREFPDTENSSSFGFSRGEWKGDTLVVTSTHLNPAFMSSRGQPVSADARTVEHFYFDDRGYLHADMWVHDPVNYTRPPHHRRVFDQDFSPRVITKVDCDPYSFFRALDLEGQLQQFWDRSAYRR